jgi:SNF2 family DNA or RNA helicase
VYYSTDWKLEDRLQSEDRAHRIGQKKNVLYIDLIAQDTIDEDVVEALRRKKNMADYITRDRVRAMLAGRGLKQERDNYVD